MQIMDLKFDATARDLVVSKRDFVETSDTGGQNGAILKDARCFNLGYPTYGIGLESVVNSDQSVTVFEMNRWKSQVKNDGAKSASFSLAQTDGLIDVTINVTY